MTLLDNPEEEKKLSEEELMSMALQLSTEAKDSLKQLSEHYEK